MRRYAKHVRTAGLALALIVVTGCSQSAELVRFNDQIAESNRKLARAAWEFREAIIPLSNNQKADFNRVKASHDKLLALVKQIREERKKVKVPKGAEEFHKAYDAYLEGQQQIVEGEFAMIVRYVENERLSLAGKWAEIQKQIFKVDEKARRTRDKLTEAQNKFANDVNMRLVQFY